MSLVSEEIAALEESLRLAELGPNPQFFQDVLADDVLLVSQDGSRITKQQVIEAHQPGSGPKFTRVEMRNMKIIEHGSAAVVSCRGIYEGPQGETALNFMRVWLKMDGRWQVIAASIHD